MKIAVAVLVILCLVPSLRGEERDPTARARLYFETGRLLFKEGDYEQAAKQFQSGYAILPRPQFLFNIARCYHKLEQLDKARDAYQRYLREAPADDPDRERATRSLDDIESKRPKEPAPPPIGTPPSSPQAAPAPSNANLSLTAAPTPPRKSFARRNWWIVPVAGVVVAGAVVGIVLGVRANAVSCATMPNPKLCIDDR